jgi:hypothetical protein
MPSYKVVFVNNLDFTYDEFNMADDQTEFILDALSKKVNEHLADGWTCVGGVSVKIIQENSVIFYNIAAFQSMVKN